MGGRRRGRRGAVKAASAFPTVETTSTSEVTSNTSSHTVTLPSGIASGDLLLMIFSTDGAVTITWPSEGTEWIELLQFDTGTENTLGIAWREADGTEGASITVTTSGAEQSSACGYRITSAIDPDTQAPEISTTSNGTNSSPDPNAITPTGGAKNYLFVAIEGHDHTDTTDTFPTSYDVSQISQTHSNTVGASCAMAGRQLNAASDDPGAFGLSGNEEWVAAAVAVHPA